MQFHNSSSSNKNNENSNSKSLMYEYSEDGDDVLDQQHHQQEEEEEQHDEDYEHGFEEDDGGHEIYLEGDDNEYNEEDDDDNDEEHLNISHYWTEDEDMAEENFPPTRTIYSVKDFHKEYQHDNSGLLDDSDNDLETRSEGSKSVSFGKKKKVFHFCKHPMEKAPESYFSEPSYEESDSSDSDDERDDSNDDSDDDDDEKDDSDREIYLYYNQRQHSFNDEDDEQQEGDVSDEDSDDERDDQDEHHHYGIPRKSRVEIQREKQTEDEDEYYDRSIKGNSNNEDEEEENLSDSSTKINSDIEDDGETVVKADNKSNNDSTGSPNGKFFDISSYNPFGNDKSTDYLRNLNSNRLAVNTAVTSSDDPAASPRKWAMNKPQIIRYQQRFPPPQQQKEEESDEEESDEVSGEEDDEVDTTEEVDSDRLNEMIEKRSEIERELKEYRDKSEHERRRLKDCFIQAKQNLKQKIELASQQITNSPSLLSSSTQSTTSSTSTSSPASFTPSSSRSFNNSHDKSLIENQSMKDELEEILISLSNLQQKINDIEDTLDTKDYPSSPIIGSKSIDNHTDHNHSLSDELIHLKQHLENERNEMINRDRELEDITKHLLDMALQVSNSVFLKNKSLDNQHSINTNSNTNTNSSSTQMNGHTESEEIQFYKDQIISLENRLDQWKHHNEMLHIELLNDKQNKTEEFENLSTKIKSVEQERDNLSTRIDQLVADLGTMEGRESMLSEMVGNLVVDKESLTQTLSEMVKDRDVAMTRFNDLVLDMREMSQSAVEQLQNIIEEMTWEREELQNKIKDTQDERNSLISTLNQLNIQIDRLRFDNVDLVFNVKQTKDTNTKLLQQAEETIKKLTDSELECTNLQNQLDIANQRLSWAESEVERLTKEMNRLVNASSLVSSDSQSSEVNESNQKIRSILEGVKEKVLSMRDLLHKEKEEILQLGSNLAMVVQLGKQNSNQTISTLRDYILREAETTKAGIVTKLHEINNKEDHAAAGSGSSSGNSPTDSTDNKYLLEEVTFQKNKLNEMQSKIVKLESQIIEITNGNNNYVGDQVMQLMRMESKIRKMEAGITGLASSRSTSTQIPVQSTTITTTTTTQYIDSSSLMMVPPPPPTTTSIREIPSPKFEPTPVETINIEPSSINNTPNELTPKAKATATTAIITKNDNEVINSNTNISIQSVLKEVIAFGISSYCSSLFFHILQSDVNTPINIAEISNVSLRYGVGAMALTGVIKASLVATRKLFKSSKSTNSTTITTSTPALTQTTTPTPEEEEENDKTASLVTSSIATDSKLPEHDDDSSIIKETAISSALGAAVCSTVLYTKLKKPELILTGALIGLGLGGISRLIITNNSNKQQQ